MRFILLFLLFGSAFAQVNEFYVIAGLANKTRYPYISRVFYEAFAENLEIGDSTVIAAPMPDYDWEQDEEGNWVRVTIADWDHRLHANRIFTQEEMDALWMFGETRFVRPHEADDVEELLEEDGEKSRNTLILITNHGGSPETFVGDEVRRDKGDGTIDPGFYTRGTRMRSSISMAESDESFSISDFGKMVHRNFDDNDTVRLVGLQCFAGSIHDISFKEDNTCSAASTDWLTTSTSLTSQSLYGEGMMVEKSAAPEDKQFDLNRDGKTSLQEAHLAGLANDTLNFGRGQLSSMAYVDKVLGEGAYGMEPDTEYYNPAEDPALQNFDDCVTCLSMDQFPYEIAGFINDIEEIQAHLQQGFYVPQIHQLTTEELMEIPSMLRTPYENLLKSGVLSDLQREVERGITSKQHAYQRIQDRLLKLEESDEFDSDLHNAYVEIAQDLRKDIEKLICPLRGITNYFLHLKKVARFYQTASRNQKSKYIQLLACEMEPL